MTHAAGPFSPHAESRDPNNATVLIQMTKSRSFVRAFAPLVRAFASLVRAFAPLVRVRVPVRVTVLGSQYAMIKPMAQLLERLLESTQISYISYITFPIYRSLSSELVLSQIMGQTWAEQRGASQAWLGSISFLTLMRDRSKIERIWAGARQVTWGKRCPVDIL